MSEETKVEQNFIEKSDVPKKSNGKKWVATSVIVVVLIALITGIGIYNTPTNKLLRQLDLGNRYLEEQNYEKAVVEFDKAISIDPMCVDAYLGKAEAYVGMDDIDMAMQTLEEGYDLTHDERLLEAIGESYAFDDVHNAHSLGWEYDDIEVESSNMPDKNVGNAELSAEVPHYYTVYFDSSFTDNGDYYEVTGKVVDGIMIPANVVEGMSAGDRYSYDDVDFIYEQQETYENDNYVYYTFTDDSGNQYVVNTHSSMGSNGVTYYYVQDIREYNYAGEPISPGGMLYILVDESYIFYISKQQYVSICTNVEETGHGGSSGSYESYAVEDIVEKDIRDFDGNLFTQAIGLPVSISVDNEGRIIGYSLHRGELAGNYIDKSGQIKELNNIIR